MIVRPLCLCHREPMLSDGNGGMRCGVDQRRRVAAVTARNRQIILAEVEARGGCCQDCDLPYEDGVHEWHHREPLLKTGEVMGMLTCSPARIRNELAKCDLLCPTCHKRRHLHMPKHPRAGLPPETFAAEFFQLSLEAS